MTYSAPELIVLGPAMLLVQGGLDGFDDNTNPDREQPMITTLGLDD
jgi:hypothetical protein